MACSVDMNSLRERVEALLGEECEHFEQHVQGSHHQTYLAQMSRTGKILIRVVIQPKSRGSGISSPSKMPSEIATMRFLKEHSTIPIPRVYGYDDDSNGNIGGNFAVLEYVDGRRVDQIWNSLTEAQREKLTLSLADLWSQLMGQSFEKIGSLYEQPEGRFFVGPMTFLPSNNHFAISAPDETKCGPFSTTQEWLEANARQELAYKLSLTPPPEASSRINAVLDSICQSDDLQSSKSWAASHLSIEHVDYSTHNILVSSADPTVILAVLDWEGARIVPMWAMNPVFRWPHNSSELENKRLRALMRDRISSQVPGWRDAIGELCQHLRLLYQKAKLSDRDPQIIQPDALLMSHDL